MKRVTPPDNVPIDERRLARQDSETGIVDCADRSGGVEGTTAQETLCAVHATSKSEKGTHGDKK